MSMLSEIFSKIFSFRISIKENKWKLVLRVYFSSNITPIKMAVQVFQSKTTDLNAPPLIVMHGLLGAKQNFRSICKGLQSKSKRKIYNVDARNHGDSPHDPGHSLEHMCADVLFLMHEQSLNRVSVMGHSMGGCVMMLFALKYPQLVEKAIIVDVSPISFPEKIEDIEKGFLAIKKIAIPSNLSLVNGLKMAENQLVEVITDKTVVQFILQNLKKSETGEFVWIPNIDVLHTNAMKLFDKKLFSEMAPFGGPVMFIGGKYSNFINPNDWPKIKRIFPKAELEWLDAGHLVHFKQPEKFIELVASFLKN